MGKLVKLISLMSIVLFSAYSFAKLPESVKIGTDASYAPFELKDSSGKIVGFDIDLADALCERVNIKCTYVVTDFDGLIPSLLARKIDLIVSSLSITEKRQKQIDFSNKLFSANPRLIAASGSPLLPTAESLKGKRVGVEQGTTQEHYANEKWRPNGVQVISYQNQLQVYSDLKAGRLDVAFQDEVTGDEGFLKQSEGKGFAFAGEALEDLTYFGEGTGIGFRKQDTELREAFNKALAEILADGTYKKINDKYFTFNVYGK